MNRYPFPGRRWLMDAINVLYSHECESRQCGQLIKQSEIHKSRFLPTSHPLYQKLAGIVKYLLAAIKEEDWKINIVDAPEITNAFVLPVRLFETKDLGGEDIQCVYCPIIGRFTFVYNVSDGSESKTECPDPVSELDACPSGSGLNVRFRRCSFEDHGLERLQESPCPVAGEYTGVIPDAPSVCAKLSSNCRTPEMMYYTVSNLSHPGVYEGSCFGDHPSPQPTIPSRWPPEPTKPWKPITAPPRGTRGGRQFSVAVMLVLCPLLLCVW